MEDKDLNLAIVKRKLFEVEYEDPETGEHVTVNEWFDDTLKFPAKMWAEDYGYAKADKGWYRVREILNHGEVCTIANNEHRGRATALAYHKQFIGDL